MASQVYQLGGYGVTSILNPCIQATRNPNSSDIYSPNGNAYQISQQWLNTTTDTFFEYAGSGSWIVLGGSSADVNTINNLSPTAGNITIAGTTNRVNVSSTGSTVTLTLPNTVSGLTGVSANTLTAASGAITATNGNLVLATAGNKLSIATGANASVGSVALVAGTKTVTTTAVSASSLIFVTVGALGTVAVPKAMKVSNIVAGTSFDITSADNTDTSTVNWLIIN